MERVRHELGFSNLFRVNLIGLKGGLAMMWHSEDVVGVVNYSSNHIHIGVIQLLVGSPG